jgi:serine/threonine-protein kinase
MACLARSPDERPASADEVLAKLDAALTAPAVSRRQRWQYAAVAVALIGLAALGGARLLGRTAPGMNAPRRSTSNMEASEWYRLGKDPSLLRERNGSRQAVDYLKRAIAADSNFAGAWAGLASALLMLTGDELTLAAQAESAAVRAVMLDDSLAEAHAALGWTKMQARDWSAARRELQRAIDLDPRTPRVYEGLARYHLWTGSPEQQLAAALRGVEYDAVSYSAVRELALALSMNGRCDEAVERLLPLKRLPPPAAVAGVVRGQCFAAQGRWNEAIGEYRWAMEVSQANTALAFLGYAYARAGKRDSALFILNDLLSGRRKSHGSFGIASVYLGLGQLDEALAWMEKAATEGTVRVYVMGPMFDELRRDPRFERVRRRLRL